MKSKKSYFKEADGLLISHLTKDEKSSFAVDMKST